jgi:hypothetical protein
VSMVTPPWALNTRWRVEKMCSRMDISSGDQSRVPCCPINIDNRNVQCDIPWES